MSVLVTGGAGFIGIHTARLLARSGLQAIVLDNLSTSLLSGDSSATLIEGSVSDTVLVRKILREYEITAVLHLAASANVADSLRRPGFYFANNTAATAVLLDAMMSEGVRQLVIASSCSVYGNCESAAAREDDLAIPVSPYGESKLATERMLPWYERAFGLHWTALRYFNVAGAADGIGEDIRTSRRIIPRAVNAALRQNSALDVFGTGFATADGSAVRDFVHVADVARANLLALRYVEQDKPGAVINIGSGVGVSVFDILGAVEAQSGQAIRWRTRSARTGDPGQAICDPSRAEQLLRWSPQCSSLEEIVDSVLGANKVQARRLAS